MKNKNKISYSLTESVLESRDINSAIKVLKSKKITMGPKTKQIEAYFQNKIVKTNSLMVNSGSSANLLIFQCLINPMVKKLKPGDEVLIPAICWSTSLWPIIQSGLKVKFVDIDLSTLNIDLNDLKKKISKKTKAIMPLHFAGLPCDQDGVYQLAKKYNLRVIEDGTHAFGTSINNRKIGSYGDISCFSFDPVKIITAVDGGCIIVSLLYSYDNDILGIQYHNPNL
jgi:CDP-6-deoxy-D-xylo-4-hexulose-3-dehydrase